MEDNTLLEGYVSYNDAPYALRSALKLLFGGGKKIIKNEDTPKKMLNEYKQAIFNKEYERKHPEIIRGIIDAKNREITEWNKTHPKQKQPLWSFDKYNKPTISYDNYNPIYIDGRVTSGIAPNATFGQNVQAMFKNDPSYNAQMTLGSANYTIDKNGHVDVVDDVNVNKGTHLADPLFDIIHTIAKYRKPNEYKRVYDLGNINNWGMKYTGNDYNRQFQYDNQLGVSGLRREYNHQIDPNTFKRGWFY